MILGRGGVVVHFKWARASGTADHRRRMKAGDNKSHDQLRGVYLKDAGWLTELENGDCHSHLIATVVRDADIANGLRPRLRLPPDVYQHTSC